MRPAITLHIPPDELSLDLTFSSGQLFRWKQVRPGVWDGPLGGNFITIARDDCRVLVWSRGESVEEESVRRFLRLDTPLAGVRDEIAARDPSVRWLFEGYAGLRVLAQPPIECLLSFACSAATNLARIRWSIEEICSRFGESVPGGHAFPGLAAIASAVAGDLRVGGMEFRCRNLSAAARSLHAAGGERFLADVRNLPYEEAAAALATLPGIGPKIADCALLFSLGFDCAFPLDTHTWRMAARHCRAPAFPRTARGYRETSRFLREKYGPYAGWLQQYLFVHDLASGSPAGPAVEARKRG